MAKVSKTTKKIVSVKYWESRLYRFNILVPENVTAKDIEETCLSWPDSLLQRGDPDFDYDVSTTGERLIDGPSHGHHFEMIPEKGRWKVRFDDWSKRKRQVVEVVI